ncbi:ABC transporter substrate-binding protein [Paenibacillus darwinianus]|uniref:ABC transporter substrate-binding protein n=1 Tax=Paenibacillus darwinianus TaxID=1380763 RepID=A0A9W5W836_9BACL|nr:extracellular solute-binding protein [Paenibacillus darwinianus]EXX89460.1 ABC transporter substrate-binding protein [Paenibacillus darwinianus]EXX90748.1 ABC transporter substrate-binding protein [Paenibacillus darwinianus]EXX90900.1 ABC transporter substrate-binding protein [Paenibacillus darwinianus]
MKKKGFKPLAMLLCTILLTGLLAACGGTASKGSPEGGAGAGKDATAGGKTEETAEEVTITLLVDNTQDSVNTANAYIEAFKKKSPNITVELETRPGGSEGDNIVKTRLATGDMTDVFFYNSGSLMQALTPEKNLLDLTNEPFQANVIDSFKPTVSYNGKVYGVPTSSTTAGGWFYNKKVYADLGLKVPKTWSELIANNEKIKAAGLTPVIGTFKDTWTSQLVVLADYYNVQAQVPTFAEDFTARKATNADTPAALRSFEKLQELNDKGFMNKDLLATTYDAGLKMLAEGKGAHYPMLSFATPAIVQNFPDQIDNIGFFAQPGDDVGKNGLTIWMPGAGYIYKESKRIEEAKQFLAFVASVEGTVTVSAVSKPTGPYLIKDAVVPDDVPALVKDMLPYFETDKTAPALEFVSPIKGPSLEQITVEVGSGIKSAKEGAAAYDKDVEKQAKQLGLEGW